MAGLGSHANRDKRLESALQMRQHWKGVEWIPRKAAPFDRGDFNKSAYQSSSVVQSHTSGERKVDFFSAPLLLSMAALLLLMNSFAIPVLAELQSSKGIKTIRATLS